MNILHFCPSQSFSGLEQYALEMALDQKARGHNVTFGVYPGTTLEKKALEAGLPTLAYNTDRFTEAFQFYKKHRSFISALDVIHLHSTQEVPRFFQMKTLQKILGGKFPKIILQCHLWINHRKKDLLHRLFYSVVDQVWCSSTPAKKALEDCLPVSPIKIIIVNYGRNISKIEKDFLSKEEARKALGLPEKGLFLGCVSRIEKSKGIQEFLEAGLQLKKKYPEVELVLIGGPSENNSEAQGYFQNLQGKLNEIRFLGTIPHSNKYLKAFDAYVLPSYEECFSLSLLDAQLAELPVAGTNSGGTPEIVIEGKTGWLFEPQNPVAPLVAMDKALREKSMWINYGRTAAQRVKKDFDQEKIFEDILKRYATH